MKKTSYMIFVFGAFFMLFTISVTSSAFSEVEDQALKESLYFSGMPNYQILDGEEKEFDAFRFCTGKELKTVEGKYSKKFYELKEGATQASEIQISRNYVNAIKNMGGTILYDGLPWEANCEEGIPCGTGRLVTAQIGKGDKELWVQVNTCNSGNDYTLIVVEREAMKQNVTASDMLNALNTQGHVTLYINFDTGKSVIKPESRPVIDQIVSLMKDNPDIKIGVEGHTDNVGDFKKNKILSENRAKAVVSAIVKQGVNASRLSAAGFGQDKPIANNNTEEGRAKNRRVELVKK